MDEPITSAEAFREAVVRYTKAHEALRAASAKARDLRKDVRTLEAGLLGYMQNQNIDECAMDNGSRLVRKTTKKTEGLKKEHITGELRRVMADDGAVTDAVANMYNRRLTDVQETLALLKDA